MSEQQNIEKDDLTMALARAYYTPLGWSLDDEEMDPDDLDSCRKSFEPVAALVRTMLAAAKAEALHEAADLIAANVLGAGFEEWLRKRASRLSPANPTEEDR